MPSSTAAVFMMIGPPASGKTTLVEKISGPLGATILDPNAIRQRHPELEHREVFRHLEKLAEELLALGQDVIIDATNTNPTHRVQLLFNIEQYARCVIGVWVWTPVRLCLERHAERQARGVRLMVTPEQLRGMAAEVRTIPPSTKEGFEVVVLVNPTMPAHELIQRLQVHSAPTP